jgi:RimJ/RimL family protein N-acetyltransferase
MVEISPAEMGSLTGWFEPEQPGWITIGPHVRDTGHGRCWVDRGAVLVQTADNYVLLGDAPESFPPLRGFVFAAPRLEASLRAAFDRVGVWDRVEYLLDGAPRAGGVAGSFEVRRLDVADAPALAGLSARSAWVHDTWGGAGGLAASGYGWAAFDGPDLASVACTFFLGRRYEELAVVTEPAYEGRGLSTACAARLCEDVRSRGHVASWSTSPDNVASFRVAEKLGFEFVGTGRLYAVEMDVPS